MIPDGAQVDAREAGHVSSLVRDDVTPSLEPKWRRWKFAVPRLDTIYRCFLIVQSLKAKSNG